MDYLSAQGGYLSDTYVYTGSDGRVAATCGSSGGGQSCFSKKLGNPRSCAAAVTWAKSHRTTRRHDDYYRRCDHVVGLAYGWSHSGSTTAYVHWTQIPARYRQRGDTSVPAGGLAFFSGGAGHVMISIGGGKCVPNDIHGNGTLTTTTIHEIRSRWGKPYLGGPSPGSRSTADGRDRPAPAPTPGAPDGPSTVDPADRPRSLRPGSPATAGDRRHVAGRAGDGRPRLTRTGRAGSRRPAGGA